MAEEENTGIFTADEIEQQNMVKKVRADVVSSMVKGGVPEKVGELRILNEYLNSIDDNIHRTATNRLKHSENENREATLDKVAAALLSINSKPTEVVNRIVVVDDSVIPTDIVPGETEISPGQLDMNDFVPTDD